MNVINYAYAEQSQFHFLVSLMYCFCCQVVPGSTTVPSVQRVSAVAEPQDVVDDRDQPLYVNAKQYHRILKRRQARAKLEAAGKIPKERRVRFTILAV